MTATMLTSGDFVQVKNTGSEPYDFRWDGKVYTIAPGKTRMIPFDAMVNECGDPRSADKWVRLPIGDGETMDIPPRDWEIARLRTKHAGAGTMVGVEGLPNRPWCEVYDDEGNQILTVLDDPSGSHIIAVTQTGSDIAEQNRLIHQLQSRLTQLEAHTQLENEPGSDDAVDVPSDD